MQKPDSLLPAGRVVSLHLHGAAPRGPMQTCAAIEVVTEQGIKGEPRYFGRGSRRQVTLMEREQIAAHATALGLAGFAAGAVRSNLETEGVNLIALIGQRIQIGGALLEIYEARSPCEQMNALAPGLRELMDDQRQGVLATVVRSGTIKAGDAITLVKAGTGAFSTA